MSSTITLQTVVSRKTSVLESIVDDEIVMANFTTGNYYGLDKVSTYIWQMLTTPRAVNEICTQLCEEFDVAEEICRKDLLTFLGKMAEEQLINVHS